MPHRPKSFEYLPILCYFRRSLYDYHYVCFGCWWKYSDKIVPKLINDLFGWPFPPSPTTRARDVGGYNGH